MGISALKNIILRAFFVVNKAFSFLCPNKYGIA